MYSNAFANSWLAWNIRWAWKKFEFKKKWNFKKQKEKKKHSSCCFMSRVRRSQLIVYYGKCMFVCAHIYCFMHSFRPRNCNYKLGVSWLELNRLHIYPSAGFECVDTRAHCTLVEANSIKQLLWIMANALSAHIRSIYAFKLMSTKLRERKNKTEPVVMIESTSISPTHI